MTEKELVDIDVKLKHMTDKAWLITDGKITCWVPKSQCELNRSGKTYVLTIPVYMAEEKGLV